MRGDDAAEAAVYREPMAARSTSIVRLSALLIAVIQVAGTYGATQRQIDATAMVLVLVGPSLIRGGTIELGFGRAVVTALAYTAVAFTATLLLMSRRDVTS